MPKIGKLKMEFTLSRTYFVAAIIMIALIPTAVSLFPVITTFSSYYRAGILLGWFLLLCITSFFLPRVEPARDKTDVRS